MKQFKPFEASSSQEFIDPDTGFKYSAKTRTELVRHVTSYRQQNGLSPLDNLDIVLDNYQCELPINCGKCKEIKLKRGLLAYFKGSVALIKNLLVGEENQVDQVEADRRSSTCAMCPYNVIIPEEGFVTWSDDIAWHSIGDKKTINHDKLGDCAVCQCCLRAKVYLKGPFNLSDKDKRDMLKVGCWQTETKE